jgi:di/tricarboxylate transporter
VTLPIAVTLATVVLAVVLFAIERIPLEVSALSIVLVLAVTRVLTPAQALAGFSNDIVVFDFTLLSMTRGLASKGVIQLAGERLASVGKRGPTVLVVALMSLVAAVSSVVSNTVTTAAFLPVAIGAADRARVARGKLLMPLAFASMLGGTITLVGTSTNLVVSSMMQQAGLPALGFAELAPVSAPIVIAGIAAVVVLGRWLLPARSDEDENALPSREYLAEVVVKPGSRFAGAPLGDLTRGLGLTVLSVVREGATLEPDPALVLARGDALAIEEDRLSLLRVQDVRGLEMQPEVGLAGPRAEEAEVILVEAAVPVGSSLVGRSLKEAFFAEHFGLVALAISRRPAIQRLTRMQLVAGLFGTQQLSTLPLAAGDVLLLRGPRDRVRALGDARTLALLGNVEYQPTRHTKAAIAVVIFLAVLAAAATRAVPYAIVGLAGMLAMIATRCIDSGSAFRVDWRVALLIACMLSLGTAMDKTGAGRYVGSLLLPVAARLGPYGVLGVLMIATVALSGPMSNQAAAAVLLPIALGIAQQLGVAPRPFAIGVCLAASCSFMTPLEPSCVLVYGPGRYRFADFVKLGTPLTVLVLGALTIAIPWRWPF